MKELWLLAGTLFSLFFVFGLALGKMPARGPPYDRKTQPVWYWLWGALWLGFAGYFFWQAFTSP